MYCIKNNHDEFPVYVRWHGPNPDRLFDDFAVAGGKWAAKIEKRYEATEPGSRMLEFGTTNSFGYEEEAETHFFVAEEFNSSSKDQTHLLFPVQATPLDLVQRTFSDVIGDPTQLREFLDAYRTSPQGGDTISIYSYSAGWVPADAEAFNQMALGEPLENYDGPYVPISYRVRSTLTAESQIVETQLQFWVGHFQLDQQASAIAEEFGTLQGLSLVSSSGAYEDIRQLDEGDRIDLSEVAVALTEVIDEREFGFGQIAPLSVGLSLNGVSFSGIHAQVLRN